MNTIQSTTTFPTFDKIPEGMEVNKKFHSGEKIPFNIKVEGEVFNYETTGQVLNLAKSIFVKVSANGPEFKLRDEDPWKSFEEMFTGRLGVTIGASENDTLAGDVYLLANIRQ